MSKIHTIILFILAFNINALSQDVFNNKIDTLLNSMSKIILEDLTKDSINISPRPWIGFGDSFELTVKFDSKDSYQITSLSRPDSLRQKSNKWKLRNSFKFRLFTNYIYVNNDFPYNTFEYFSYKFMQVLDRSNLQSDAVYGEYIFKVSPKELTVIDKKTEIIKGIEAIKRKQFLKW
ncbi:MAG: hypothetical protein ACWA6U_00260 [Breznakibacter sp.]